MFSLATSLSYGISASGSKPYAGSACAWAPLQQQQCGSSPTCRLSQPAAVPGSPQHAASVSSNSSAALGGRHSIVQQQQQFAAGEVLERAAAAVRPAGPPPEQSVASSSGSSSRSSVSIHGRSGRNQQQVQHTAQQGSHRRNSAENSAHALSSFGAVALAAESADSAAAVAASVAAAVAATDLQQRAPHSAASSRSNGSSSSSRNGNGYGAAWQPTSAGSSSNGSSVTISDADWPLMQFIREECHTFEDLATVYTDSSEQFAACHCAAALYQLAVIWQQLKEQGPKQAQVFTHASQLQKQRAQMQQLGSALLRRLTGCMAQAQLRDFADAWYAVDTLDLLQTSSAAAAAAAADHAAAVSNGADHADGLVSQPLSSAATAAAAAPANAAFVAASLQHSSQLLRGSQVQLRHLSRLLTTFAHLRINPGTDWWAAALDAAAGGMEQVLLLPVAQMSEADLFSSNISSEADRYQQQQQQQQQQQTPGSSSWNNSYGCNITSHTNAQAAALIGWAVADLQAPASPAWWQLFHATSAHLMPAMFASHLCNCLYAFARTRQTPSAAWMDAFYARCSQQMGYFTSQGFANVLWGLAVLQQQPPRDWLVSLDAASAAKLQQCTLQHLGMSVWAMARLQQQAQATHTLSGHPSAAALSVAGGSSAQQQQQRVPSAAWQEQAWVQLSRLNLDAQAPQGLACLLWGIVRLQLQLPQARLQELEGMCVEVVRLMAPQALAVTTWALGNLRGAAVSRRFLRQAYSRCSQNGAELLQQLPPHGLCMLLHGLSQMDAWHPDSFKKHLLGAVTARLPSPQQRQQHSKKQRRKQPDAGAMAQQPASSQQWDGSPGSRAAVLQPQSLPVVLLYLRRLWIDVPADVLSAVEGALQQQMQTLPVKTLCIGLFALAASKHIAETAFVTSVLARIEGRLQSCSALDVTHVLFSLAVMSSRGGDLRQVLQQQEHQAQLRKLVMRVEQCVDQLDHRALAMLMWSLGSLQLQPSEPFLQSVMASTLQLMPSMSLLSVVTILGAFRALHYLPPLPWMVEVCSAARAKVSADSTAKKWQQRACVRRFEETVAWYNQALQQQMGASSGSSSAEGSVDGGEQDQEEWGQEPLTEQEMQRRRARMALLAAAEKSEAVLAAAVGIAAAVAQRWHP